VVTKVCKVVPDVKKTVKWVYDCKPEDFCLPRCSCPLHGLKKHHGCEKCASCMQCDRPMNRNLLIKRQVVEECPTTKCVIETVVEKVPYVVHRKVPCGPDGKPLVVPGGVPPGVLPEPIPAPKTPRPYMPPARAAAPGSLPVVPPTAVPASLKTRR
jgi:hypothetical protein